MSHKYTSTNSTSVIRPQYGSIISIHGVKRTRTSRRSAKRSPLTNVTGPGEISLMGLAVVHRISPVLASKATHPPAVVVCVDGLRVKGSRSPLAMFVYTRFPSVAAPHIPPPWLLPGPAFCTINPECKYAYLVKCHTYLDHV
ncbi:hypothetical protein ACH5RR_035827 [Cinchona calisaya]|uniref:Uncharacterized protein n=1 Tax=Cinchona calisaya TaxID=153742 RepID=A0ABD2Y647_9GENT